jgi:hypothetical protein
VILDEAEALLDPVSDIEGFMLACLVDASTGMVLASRKDQDGISLPTAAAGAADIANVLSQLTGELPVDGLEDVMVTFRQQLYVIRMVSPEPQTAWWAAPISSYGPRCVVPAASPAGRADIMTAPVTANGSLTSTPTSTATWPAAGRSR